MPMPFFASYVTQFRKDYHINKKSFENEEKLMPICHLSFNASHTNQHMMGMYEGRLKSSLTGGSALLLCRGRR
jgi:hypothetical protein